MIQKIKQTFVKKQMKNVRNAATVIIVLVCSLTFMVVASAVSNYNVSILDEAKQTLATTIKSVPIETKTQTELAQDKDDLTQNSVTFQKKLVVRTLKVTTKISEKVTKEAVDRAILVSSKIEAKKVALKTGVSAISDLTVPADFKLDAKGMPVNYKKIIDGTSTAYSGGGTTATGRPAMEGYIAVNPKQIPYGTKLYVVSRDGRYVYGYCIAADTGGFARNNSCTIDIYMDTEDECIQFGRRAVRIFVLD